MGIRIALSFSHPGGLASGRSAGEKGKRKKSSAAGSFGVAQSPKSSYGGTMIMVTSLLRVARGFSKKSK
jgi:hypothetical protein